MLGAEVPGLGPKNEQFCPHLGAVGGGRLQSLGVERHGHHPLRRNESLGVAVSGQLHRALHERRPDGQGSRVARQPQVAVVIETHPDSTEEIGGKPDKPTVARSPGLAGSRCGESAGTGTRPGATVHVVHQKVQNKICDTCVQHGDGPVFRLQQDFVLGGQHNINQGGRDAIATVGKEGIGSRDFQGGGVVSTQRDRRRRPQAGIQPGGHRQRGHPVIAGHLCHLDGGHVEGADQGVARCDHAVKLLSIIRRLVFLALPEKRGGLIHNRGHRSNGALRSLQSGGEGSGKDKRLEGGTRLPVGDSAVELGLVIVPAPHQSLDLAGVRVEGNQSNLREGGRVFPLSKSLGDLGIHFRQGFPDGLSGGALQTKVKAGVDAIASRDQLLLREVPQQLVAHQVNEIGGVVGLHILRRNGEFFFPGLVGLLLGDQTNRHHALEDMVAPLAGAVRVAVEIVKVGAANDAGQQGGLAQGQPADVLAEVGLGAFAEAVDAEAAALAQVDFIGVQLEDFFFLKAPLELHGNQCLGRLTFPTEVAGEKEAARQLHGQGAGPLDTSALALSQPDTHVVPQGAGHIHHRDAGVVEEAPVLGRQNRLHQLRRNVGVGHQTALGAAAIEQVGDVGRLDEHRREQATRAQRDQSLDLSLLHFHPNRLGGPHRGALPGANLDHLLAALVPAVGRRLSLRAAVAEAVKLGGNLRQRGGLAYIEGCRGRINAGGIFKNLPAQPGVNQTREAKPDEAKDRSPHKRKYQESNQESSPPPPRPKAARNANTNRHEF